MKLIAEYTDGSDLQIITEKKQMAKVILLSKEFL